MCCVNVNLPNIGWKLRVGNDRVSDLLAVVDHNKRTQVKNLLSLPDLSYTSCLSLGKSHIYSSVFSSRKGEKKKFPCKKYENTSNKNNSFLKVIFILDYK